MPSTAGDQIVRTLHTPNTPVPEIALLGRAPCTILVSAAGSGITRNGSIAINRWRNDSTRDDYGQWCYIRDVTKGAVWSAGHQPLCAKYISYRAELANDRVTITRRDGDFETRTEIAAPNDRPADVRRITVSNESADDREIEVTSYQEIALATLVSDRGHRAFGNLFVQTEWLSDVNALLAMRRPRSAVDSPMWCGHAVALNEEALTTISRETDRAQFLGRGRSSRNPVAMDSAGALSGTVGAVLDPVFSLRARIRIPAGKSAYVTFTTFAAETRDEAVSIARFYSNAENADAALDSAGAEQALTLANTGVSALEAARYQSLAGKLLFNPAPPEAAIAKPDNPRLTRTALLETGIAGEYPIVLATLRTEDGLARIENLISLHQFWQRKGVHSDIVIICDGDRSASLQAAAAALVPAPSSTEPLEESGEVFAFHPGQLKPGVLELIESMARLRVTLSARTLIESFDG